MRILFLSPYQGNRWNPGHQHFRDAIQWQHDVKYYGPQYSDHQLLDKLNHVPTILEYYKSNCNGWTPEIIMTYGYRYTLPFQDLNKIKIPKVHFLCDFTPAKDLWPGTATAYYSMIKIHEYDIFFALSYQAKELLLSYNPDAKVFFLPFGVDEKIFCPEIFPDHYKRTDVYIGWSNNDAVYPLRRPIEEALVKRLGKTRVVIKRRFGEAFVRQINLSKISVNTSNIFRTMNMKNFEVMACACALFTEKVQEMNDLGFVDGQHYVSFRTPDELVDEIEYYLHYNDLLSDIAFAGYKLVKEKHTNKYRVEEMTRRLENEI